MVEMNSKRDATSTGYVGPEHVACHYVLSPSIRASVLCGASSPSMHGVEISNSQGDQIRATIIISVHTLFLKWILNHRKCA